MGRSDPNARSEDSYEAALRAADALFAAPPAPAKVEVATPSDGAPRSDRPGGRILRVIDEKPPESILDAEDDPAPKRRGRKPGSKNKPKMPVTSIDPASVAFRDLTTSDRLADRAAPSPAFAGRDERRVAVAVPDGGGNHGDVAAPLPANHVVPASRPTVRTGEPRFAWVRTQLQPGQDWKRRRLPKVCW